MFTKQDLEGAKALFNNEYFVSTIKEVEETFLSNLRTLDPHTQDTKDDLIRLQFLVKLVAALREPITGEEREVAKRKAAAKQKSS